VAALCGGQPGVFDAGVGAVVVGGEGVRVGLKLTEVQSSFSKPLHALRGIAALVVVFGHILEPVGRLDPTYKSYGPLFNSAAAVTFFFVLSGLVLTLSISRTTLSLDSYSRYAIRRIFRLLPLLWVTVAIGGFWLSTFDARAPMSFAELGLLDIPKFIAGFIGYSLKPNPPSWSIFVELVISILLPLMWAVYSSPLRWLLVLLTLGASAVVVGFQHHWNFYLINFLAGMSILSWGSVAKKVKAQTFWPCFTVIALTFYLIRPLYKWDTGQLYNDLFGFPWINLVEVLLVTPLVAAIYYNSERFSFLSRKIFVLLGETSFSIYLTHWIVIVLTTNVLLFLRPEFRLAPGVFWFVLAALVISITIPLSYASHRWIELPFMNFGKVLASRMVSRKLPLLEART
jgi:peptidoglycan/LPS O-acetylase OafA/YrhL